MHKHTQTFLLSSLHLVIYDGFISFQDDLLGSCANPPTATERFCPPCHLLDIILSRLFFISGSNYFRCATWFKTILPYPTTILMTLDWNWGNRNCTLGYCMPNGWGIWATGWRPAYLEAAFGSCICSGLPTGASCLVSAERNGLLGTCPTAQWKKQGYHPLQVVFFWKNFGRKYPTNPISKPKYWRIHNFGFDSTSNMLVSLAPCSTPKNMGWILLKTCYRCRCDL